MLQPFLSMIYNDLEEHRKLELAPTVAFSSIKPLQIKCQPYIMFMTCSRISPGVLGVIYVHFGDLSKVKVKVHRQPNIFSQLIKVLFHKFVDFCQKLPQLGIQRIEKKILPIFTSNFCFSKAKTRFAVLFHSLRFCLRAWRTM